MLAQSTRVAALLLASSLAAAAQPAPPASSDDYRDAISAYINTGDLNSPAEVLEGWDCPRLERAVTETIESGDDRRIGPAAVMHLDIGVAIVGLSNVSAWGHFELGTRLVDGLIPINPAVARNLPKPRMAEINSLRADWNGVAASAFLSVNDVGRARPFIKKGLSIAPSAALLTLRGMADEFEGEFSIRTISTR